MGLLDKFKNILLGDEDPERPAWIERLQPASYVSQSGQKVDFDYGDLNATFNKKIAVFENSNSDGVYVQNNGVGGHSFPMACFFSGGNHDKQASAFIKALLETGPGTLYHPIFGYTSVMPGGQIQYVSELVSRANQTTILVEFLETTGLQIGGQAGFQQIVDSFNDASSASFADKINTTDIVDEENFKTKFVNAVGITKRSLKAVSGTVTGVQNDIDDIGDSIIGGIDLLVGTPLTIARQTQILIDTPARIKGEIKAVLAGYRDMAQSIFGTEPDPSGYDFEAENNFYIDKLFVSSMVSSSATSSLQNEYTTKTEFVNNAKELVDLLKDYVDWSDDGYTIIDPNLDDGDGYSELLAVINSSIGTLLDSSFNAKTEFTIILDSDRGMQELCFELYGSSKPDVLDLFASTNDFSGDEYFIIKEGREIVYYL
jgi:prophage DNA circulation protein